jgi:hypothetical protein
LLFFVRVAGQIEFDEKRMDLRTAISNRTFFLSHDVTFLCSATPAYAGLSASERGWVGVG